ncbi:diaminopimelate decarboxylase [Helicobacter anseris]|uniref:Diaminopimelate decarboxylase n=1 Tax=Helicobacter anseris TaxID=375926 RepID=A0A3D8J218_9HELI|nr:diaminopimelate decarboxylase [Helicobacter anseris]RDU71538.1 diaminopimelate decarboxylase [Helicobacter anseris]
MIDFKKLAQEYQTPLYVYDLEKIQEKFKAYKNAFSGRKSLICYALKANSNLSVVHQIAELEGGADCVSIGEVKRAILAGIKPYRIIFSGVGKGDEEIKEALELDILFLNVESYQELLRIEAIAKDMQKPSRISIRVNPNIDPKTHPYISTGLSENKFGVELEEAKKMYLYAHKSEFLQPIGVHFHIGSQLTELEPIAQSAQKIAEFTRSLIALGLDIRFFDVGGGIGICYAQEKVIDLYDYAQSILAALGGLDVTIICEPGRSIVGESGYLVTKVLYEKYTNKKRFVIVDGAMNDLLRPSLYDAYHRVWFQEKQEELFQADIVGPICESGDFLAKNARLPKMQSGDLIVFENAGAYGYSMSSNYNTRMRCAEVGIKNNQTYLLKSREKFEDVVADELDNLRKNCE